MPGDCVYDMQILPYLLALLFIMHTCNMLGLVLYGSRETEYLGIVVGENLRLSQLAGTALTTRWFLAFIAY